MTKSNNNFDHKKSKQTPHHLFTKFSEKICAVTGNLWSFLIATFLIIAWMIMGPIMEFSYNWQLILDVFTTVTTFLMVFLLQNTQNRYSAMIDLKLNELILSHESAKNKLMDLSDLTDEELEELQETHRKITARHQS